MEIEPHNQHLNSARRSRRMHTALCSILLLCLTVTLLGGCVTTNNICGNESRDWANLSFPKEKYCSVPANLPFAKQYEQANRAVCKVHDNNSGIRSNISQSTADHRFLCDYIKRSEFPWGIRHVTGYLSYFALRAASINKTDPARTQTQTSESQAEKAAEGQLLDANNNPVLDSNDTPINTN